MKYVIVLSMFAVIAVSVTAFIRSDSDSDSSSESSCVVTEEDVHCESWDFQPASCMASGEILDITLKTQESNTNCVEGTNFNFTGDDVWVDSGCRGWFTVTYCAYDSSSDGDDDSSSSSDACLTAEEDVHCESWDFQPATCPASGEITDITLKTQESNTNCVEGTNFGFTGDDVWVDSGCRAWVTVTYCTSGGGDDSSSSDDDDSS